MDGVVTKPHKEKEHIPNVKMIFQNIRKDLLVLVDVDSDEDKILIMFEKCKKQSQLIDVPLVRRISPFLMK